MKKLIKLFLLPAAIATTAVAQQGPCECQHDKKKKADIVVEKKTDKAAKVAKKAPVKKVVKKKPIVVDNSKKFYVELKITNGHLGKVIVGCHEKATDKLDKKLDDMAPPPGMQTGYTVLVSPDQKYYLYRDVRAFADEVIWYFRATLNNKKFIKIQWDKTKFPAGYNFFLNDGTNGDIDMRKVSSQRITKESIWMVIAEKKATVPVKVVPAK